MSDKDIIYRQAAIEAIEKTYGSIAYQEDGFTRSDAIDILKSLPSAQPEIIHCRDCEKYGTKFCALDIWTEQAIIRRAKPDDFCSKGEERKKHETN